MVPAFFVCVRHGIESIHEISIHVWTAHSACVWPVGKNKEQTLALRMWQDQADTPLQVVHQKRREYVTIPCQDEKVTGPKRLLQTAPTMDMAAVGSLFTSTLSPCALFKAAPPLV